MADETPNENPKKAGGAMQMLVQGESMIQLALILPIACVLGWIVGSALDSHFHQGWMGITGIVLGAIAGFIQIFRMASKYLNRG